MTARASLWVKNTGRDLFPSVHVPHQTIRWQGTASSLIYFSRLSGVRE
jgi:hypothetical protein